MKDSYHRIHNLLGNPQFWYGRVDLTLIHFDFFHSLGISRIEDPQILDEEKTLMIYPSPICIPEDPLVPDIIKTCSNLVNKHKSTLHEDRLAHLIERACDYNQNITHIPLAFWKQQQLSVSEKIFGTILKLNFPKSMIDYNELEKDSLRFGSSIDTRFSDQNLALKEYEIIEEWRIAKDKKNRVDKLESEVERLKEMTSRLQKYSNRRMIMLKSYQKQTMRMLGASSRLTRLLF